MFYNSRYQSISEPEPATAPARIRGPTRYEYICDVLKTVLGIILGVLIIAFGVFAIIISCYVIGIIIGILYVTYMELFEIVITSIFGKDTYYKNFALCSDTSYISNQCYKTTYTYCNA